MSKELIERVQNASQFDLEKIYSEALRSKDWKTLRFISETKNPFKPEKANKDNIIDYYIERQRWDVVYDIEKAFSKETQDLVQGPHQKSKWTYQLEELTTELMKTNRFKFSDVNGERHIIFRNGSVFNWSKIKENANFQDISLKQTDYSLYSEYMKSNSYLCTLSPNKFEEYKNQLYNQNIDNKKSVLKSDLTFQEMQAINIYTGGSYKIMNGVLRGTNNTSDPTEFRLAVIQSVMCSSGLRKLPDTSIKESYRGTGDENLEKTLAAAANKDVIRLDGFVSSTIDPNMKTFESKVALHLTNVRGMYVGPISQFPHEQEFLIPPTPLQITDYKEENGKHKFSASGVSELACLNAKGIEAYIENPHMNQVDKFTYVLAELQSQIQTLSIQSVSSPQMSKCYDEALTLYSELNNNLTSYKNQSMSTQEFEQKCVEAIDKSQPLFTGSKLENFFVAVKLLLNKVIPNLFDESAKQKALNITGRYKEAIRALPRTDPKDLAKESDKINQQLAGSEPERSNIKP